MSPLGMVSGNLNSPPLGTSASYQSPAPTKENLPECRTTNSGTGRPAHTDHKQHAPRATPRFQPTFLTRPKTMSYIELLTKVIGAILEDGLQSL